MPFLYDDNGAIQVEDVGGVKLPVFIHEDGKKSPFDADSALKTIRERNKEAQTNRERFQSAESRLKSFEGIEDAAAAKKALDLVKNYTPEQLAQAGRLEEIKASINKDWESKLKDVTEKATTLEQRFQRSAMSNAFTGSKFITEKTVLTPDIAQAYFGNNFKVLEDGSLQAVDAKGNPILSRVKPGEPATFDEAMEILVNEYPRKDSILRGTNAGGAGARNNTTVRDGNKPTMKRSDFDAADDVDRMQFLGKGGVVVD